MNPPAEGLTGGQWSALIALAMVLLVLGILIWSGRKQRAKAEHDAEQYRRKLIAAGMQKGILNEDGDPLCVVCGEIATHYSLGTGRHWLDNLPLAATLNKLYGLPWRYAVVELVEGGFRLCLVHNRAGHQRMEQAHATMRSEHAAFNAKMQQRIAALEQGGLEQLLRNDAAQIKQAIGLGRIEQVTLDASHLLSSESVHVVHSTTEEPDHP